MRFAIPIFLLWGSAAFAQLNFAQWFNPGPLSAPHQTLEGVTKCTLCHATAKGVPDTKCLSCHTEIADRMAQKKGYHAKQTQPCLACHSEHKGRNYDETGLTRLAFDHADTGWPLAGAHAPVACEKCHTQKRTNVETKTPTNRPTYLGAKTNCISCHADAHRSDSPSFQKCEKCHATEAWKPIKPRPLFSHLNETKYPLTGVHQNIDCYGCHKKKLWKPLAFAKCTNCHVDPHKGQLGPKCEKCHSTKGWRGITPGGKESKKFDHDKTAFPLTGEHREVNCLRCHGTVIGKMKNFDQCGGCHNNPHDNQFQELWDVKNNKQCSQCHTTDGWRILLFQHNRDSRYELVDQHQQVPCEQCHIDRRYRWLAKSPDCSTCHLDAHRAQFTKPCAACHTPKGFDQLTFNHNRDSPFPLVGKHQYVQCAKCHLEGRYKDIDRRCQGCHNDFHKGELAAECTQCHAPTAFNDVEFDHQRESKFPLTGQHLKNQCNQCHVNFKFKFQKMDCDTCHRDVHKGQFGTACGRCHSTETFVNKEGGGGAGGKAPKAGFHDFGEFSLGGMHDKLDCTVCHGPKAKVRGDAVQCASCHRDPHMNAFGIQCHTCHNQIAWLPSTFRHNQTGFELSGAHRFLSCNNCHFNRVFGGLPQECSFCHIKDFAPPSVIPQHAGAPTTCDSCHLTFGWRPTR